MAGNLTFEQLLLGFGRGDVRHEPGTLIAGGLTSLSPHLTEELTCRDTGMYNTQSAARSSQTPYIPSTYDFSGYHHPHHQHHHHLPGIADPSTNAWNSVYAPREEYPFCYPGSSPSPGQLSFSPPELSNTPTATGGGSSFTPFSYISGLQEPLSPRGRAQESVKPAASGEHRALVTRYFPPSLPFSFKVLFAPHSGKRRAANFAIWLH